MKMVREIESNVYYENLTNLPYYACSRFYPEIGVYDVVITKGNIPKTMSKYATPMNERMMLMLICTAHVKLDVDSINGPMVLVTQADEYYDAARDYIRRCAIDVYNYTFPCLADDNVVTNEYKNNKVFNI